MPIKTKKRQYKSTKKNKSIKSNFEKSILLHLDLNERNLICNKEVPYSEYTSFEDNFIENLSFKKRLFAYLSQSEKIRPNDNFYNYVNEKSKVEHNVVPSYILQNDNFRLVQDKVYHQMIDIYKEHIKNTSSSQAINMKNLYESAVSLNPISSSKSYMSNIIREIDELRKDKSNLWKFLGIINKNCIVSTYCPLLFEVNYDKKNTTKYCCYINPQKFTIDLSIFTKEKTLRCNCKPRFIKYLNEIFSACFGKNHNIMVENIFKCFEKIFYCFSGVEFVNNPLGYNKVLKSESLEKYNFNWEELSTELGIKDTPDFFITSDLNYLKKISTLLTEEWDSEEWRPFWLYTYLRQVIRYTQHWKKISVDYYLVFLEHSNSYGVEINAIRVLLKAFNKILSELYIQKQYNQETFKYVTNMSADLKRIFYKTIKQNKWLHTKTRDYALKKIENLKIVVGSNLTFAEDSDINYHNNELWQNILDMAKMKYNKFLMLIGENVINLLHNDWSLNHNPYSDTEVYMVNATYRPTSNSIYIPLAYIQRPFINLSGLGFEYNMAYFGFTLAHELSHSLDSNGSNYDMHGNLLNWWTDADKKKYKKIQDKINMQYFTFSNKNKDIHPEMNVSENIADIMGLHICEKYLIDYYQEKELPNILIKEKLTDFYIFYAYQMKSIMSKYTMSRMKKNNIHSLNEHRVNIPVSRSPYFKAIFNIKKGDKMYYPDSESIF